MSEPAPRVRYWLSEDGSWIRCPAPWRNFVRSIKPSHVDDRHVVRHQICEKLKEHDAIYKYRCEHRSRGYVLFPNQQSLVAWLLTYG
jgi:hypothetical protein